MRAADFSDCRNQSRSEIQVLPCSAQGSLIQSKLTRFFSSPSDTCPFESAQETAKVTTLNTRYLLITFKMAASAGPFSMLITGDGCSHSVTFQFFFCQNQTSRKTFANSLFYCKFSYFMLVIHGSIIRGSRHDSIASARFA